MKPVCVGLLGLGTVGGGTVVVLGRNADEIARRAGRGIEIGHAAAANLNRARELGLSDARLSADPAEVVRDPDVDIVVELFGGYEPAIL